MKKIFLTFLILFHFITAYCQHPIKQNLGNVASIMLPDTPKNEHTKKGLIYITNSNGMIYISSVSKIGYNLKDFLFTKHVQDSVYAGVIKGSLKMGGALLYKKNINTNGLHGIEFGYVKHYNSIISYRYHQSFYFNNILITNGVWIHDSLQTNHLKIKAFFSTFKLTVHKDDLRQRNFADVAFKSGYFVGFSIIVCLIFVIGFLVIYIIKRIAYK
ncbi:MAG TPA: hypothetical protein VGI43_16135 [Mucilaginibacter sp.]